MARVALALIIHDDISFLNAALLSFSSIPDRFMFVSRVSWSGTSGDWGRAAAIGESVGCTVIEGEWLSEREHRLAAHGHLTKHGFTHALIPDSDEIIEHSLLQFLVRVAESDLADRVYVEMDTYWKDQFHVVRPRESLTPCILVNLERSQNVDLRHFVGGRSLLLNESYGIIHHLSYAGTDERIARKISTWSHKSEVLSGWWDQIWKGWDRDKRMGNVHPTHPSAYAFVEHIDLPPALAAVGLEAEERQLLVVPPTWPTVSIIIPLHGGTDDIRACLNSLSACFSLLHDVLVVDNGSEDSAAEIAREHLRGLPGGRLIELGENRGFAHACNRGAAEAGGEVIIFLNSDTIVPRSGLIRLVEALMISGTIGAAGPYTNNAGHHQPTYTTYTSELSIDHFANDFANGPGADRDVDMLVGFCLAVRKTAWHEVGPFDEGFGLGLFEDNDLCYRLRRSGYRLVLCGRSFIHHAGSKTLRRVTSNPEQLLNLNQARFVRKWQLDLEVGFSTGLSGLSAQPIAFNPKNKPERRLAELASLVELADISLCMIVRNEERVLADCLRSAKPFFREIIVVDTGSTDRTRSIAESYGATVIDFPWTESFSEARNQSIAPARGRWIFWLDADDTLPFGCGEILLADAMNAPDDVAAFVMPVRFAANGEHAGVQVDHVKLFRNMPGLAFEGRIHEQILRTLHEVAGAGAKIVRSKAYVNHSGYDNSEEGQLRKRERDSKLLELDLAERPDHPFVLFNLGMTAHYTGDQDAAIKWLTRCLEVANKNETIVRKAYAMLGTAIARLGDPDRAHSTWLEGLQHYPEDPELHFHVARNSSDCGNLDDASKHYNAALNADISGHYSSVDTGILGFKTMHNLAVVEVQRRDYAAARHWFLKAMELAPEFRPSAFALFDVAKDHGDLKTAKEVLGFIERQEGQSESWKRMRDTLLS